MKIVEAGFADHRPRRLVLKREETEAEMIPEADLAQEADPGGLARQRRPADEPHHGRFGPERRIGVEVLAAIGP